MRFSRAWLRGFAIGVIVYVPMLLLALGMERTLHVLTFSAITVALYYIVQVLVRPLEILAQILFSPLGLTEYQVVRMIAPVITAFIYGLIGAYISTYLQKRKKASDEL